MSIDVWQPSWQHEDVELKEDNLVYDGFYQVRRFTFRHRCFSGDWSPWLDREQVFRADAAAVLLVDPERDVLVMVEQLRVGLLKRHQSASPWLLEIVAGLCEPLEDAKHTIEREALEEAGCRIHRLISMGEFYTTPGGAAEKVTLYCGICQAPEETGRLHGVDEEHEDIKVHVLPIDAVLSDFLKGKILSSSPTVIALQWLAYHREKGDFSTIISDK